MPLESLKKIGQRGYSYGKDLLLESGSGLGIFQAKNAVESVQGLFEVYSTLGEGCTISIKLPLVNPPLWFAKNLEINNFLTTIISVDDDQSIHQIWENRFATIGITHLGVKHIQFTSLTRFEEWLEKNSRERCFFLIDYEFLNQASNGLQTISRYGIENQSFLVTSRYELASLQISAVNRGLKILPKGLAFQIPIVKMKETLKRDVVVLIDDDSEIVHTIWKMSAQSAKIDLFCYCSLYEFLKDNWQGKIGAKVYIDFNLGAKLRGDSVAKELFGLGFKEIYLTTGAEAKQFADLPFIKGVVGKDPPFSHSPSTVETIGANVFCSKLESSFKNRSFQPEVEN